MEDTKNFIEAFVEEDLAPGGRFAGQTIHTRFPPEPNGYLHIGSAKAIFINYTIAKHYGGLFNLRFDDTNPAREGDEYVQSILQDLKWLGAEPNGGIFYGSDYFEKDYEYAVELIKKGLAYVCDLTPEQAREYRGDIGKPAISPYRDRDVEENLDLFERMKNGEFPEGSRTLRAKIDLASGNFNMRDPVIYRIRYMHHHRQGDKWCIYPMYDFAHPIQDALEGITHSLCSLEFEAHRPLYDWVVNNVSVPNKPRQIEFARLGIDHTVMSKRKLRKLVEEGIVSGWDDPRMPTLVGLRRRGYTAAALQKFVENCGVSRVAGGWIDYSVLEQSLREDLESTAERRAGVVHPLKLILDNYPEGKSEELVCPNHPQKPEMGTRTVTMSRELWIEQEDFAEVPPKGYRRLTIPADGTPAKPVRLRNSYVIVPTSFEKDAEGNVVCVHADYLPETKSGTAGADSVKTKAAIHWLDAKTAVPAQFRMYDRLFTVPQPDSAEDFLDVLNRDSKFVSQGFVEPNVAAAAPETRYQFERVGYFVTDIKDHSADHPVLNLAVGLRDSWGKNAK